MPELPQAIVAILLALTLALLAVTSLVGIPLFAISILNYFRSLRTLYRATRLVSPGDWQAMRAMTLEQHGEDWLRRRLRRHNTVMRGRHCRYQIFPMLLLGGASGAVVLGWWWLAQAFRATKGAAPPAVLLALFCALIAGALIAGFFVRVVRRTRQLAAKLAAARD